MRSEAISHGKWRGGALNWIQRKPLAAARPLVADHILVNEQLVMTPGAAILSYIDKYYQYEL